MGSDDPSGSVRPTRVPGSPLDVVDEPGTAHAEQGYVVLDGPRGMAVTLTPAAALATARRLDEAAHQAQRDASNGPVGPAPRDDESSGSGLSGT